MAKKYGGKVRKATKKRKINLTSEEKGILKESRRLGALNQKIDKFNYAIDGPIKDSTIEQYTEYVKNLNPGLEQLNIYYWETQAAAHIDKAKTWKGKDAWRENKNLNIGREIATLQNNEFLTDATRRNYYNSYLLEEETSEPKMSFEEWEAKGGVQEKAAQILAKERELLKDGTKSSKEISVMIGKIFFGSP